MEKTFCEIAGQGFLGITLVVAFPDGQSDHP